MTKKVCSCINELPDDLILKILSFVSTKHVVVTSLLSKKWKSLWTRVPILKYDVRDHTRFERFLDKSLFSHQSHVLESLHVELSVTLWNKDIGPWIRTALHHHHCHLRELEIDACIVHTVLPPELFTCKTLVVLKLKGIVIDVEAPLTTVSLPSLKTLHIDHSSLFDFGSLQMLLSNCNFITDLMVIRESRFFFAEYDVSWCKTLMALKLEGLKDVISISSSSAVCLPLLKTLHVARMEDFNNDSFCRLLSNCPVLSDLTLEEKTSDVLLNLDIDMPYLQRLSIITRVDADSKHIFSLMKNYTRKLAIIAPSFKYFSIQELAYASRYRYIVRVRLGVPSKLEDASTFSRIVHLELSICSERSVEMLVDLLLCFTKLVVLKLEHVYLLTPLGRWEPPSLVPECLLSSLEALEWKGYTGRYGDKDLVSYLLNHALCLKTAKIFYKTYPCEVEAKQQIEEDLASMPRGSKSCEVLLNEIIRNKANC
ncbi:FBD, F-box and Leucine Rich Repeat domains containing protein [Arabidopsis thaliana]|uniref:FBD, F-box and Leucine Rich Repeat domains containing protein n=1 Tax=Arabidopsis thaliana TaxID=3702 RepID=A0A1I9LP86_ARATH|nr:FBD, F-box and Leucine Rich Repeat domains containing protein [Arabidopsis thaliana]ANM64394.1 FBD, F-box and Leucine Rich Repeat domains containing protein [Arabidopsis thaliana]|eukprot:NP_001326425.1 FBD, F-box and Leucine Rich Repeat domains containing protein [Arabidopsis thaliana]